MAEKPWTYGVTIATAKTTVADLIAQKAFERRETIDWKRNLVFTCFGFFYLGGFQYYLYNSMFPRFFPGTGTRMACKKLFVDQAIHHPFCYFPVFYGVNEIVKGGSVEQAVDNYKNEIVEGMVALWKVWVPAMAICFTVVPAHLVIPYVSGVSFLWTTILSLMQGKFEAIRQKKLLQKMEKP
eukprot:CAMPEP_0174270374 /NCGR_PEP_ID=MMETSP0439-20130205/44230_1 /TAXON_ID=0 /ORGANISM="Stereomyxa ramosa, Strain Chinc5" /LENGTH=181 /DNA_ID=CAMNT_0015359675 /DNA_START=29 /DNA_END=574 /DNA_ORIENTATION=-